MTDHRTYNLLDHIDFEDYAEKYGRVYAKAIRFSLAYSVRGKLRAMTYNEILKLDNRIPAGRAVIDAVNPNPYYSRECAISTLVAVYKAHRACEAVPSFDASYFAEHEWRNLSYATERGIVFG